VFSGDAAQLGDWLIWELTDRPMLKKAWCHFSSYDSEARRLQTSAIRLQRWIIGLGIVATGLAVLFTQVSGLGQEAVHWGLILIPVTIAFLVGWNSRRAVGKRWIIFRAAAESVKAETFRYRMRVEPYQVDAIRQETLRDRLEVIIKELVSTEAASGNLSPASGAGPPPSVDAASLRDLDAERYVQHRTVDQTAYYHGRVREKIWRRDGLQALTVAMGGAGTVLAASHVEPLVALTSAAGAGAAAYLTARQHEGDILVYNQTAVDLEAAYLTWVASGPFRSRPDVVARLVERTEEILSDEVGGWARRMARALEDEARRQQRDVDAVDKRESARG
jgi:hypothetical protein